MPYVAPGAAITDSLENTLLQRAALQRQSVLDAQNARKAQDEHDEAMNALQEKRTEAQAKVEDRERSQITKQVTDMVPGDIPDADLIARARKYHVPLPTTTAIPDTVPAPAPPPIRVVQSLGGETPAVPPPTPQPIRFAGSPKERLAEVADKKQSDFIQTLPKDSPERKALEYELLNPGKTAPAGMFRTATTDSEAVFQQNPRTGSVERLIDGKWSPWTGDVPKGAHFMTVPPPKDTSAADAREATRHDNNYKSAVAELEKAAAPIAAQAGTINDLGIMLNARTPQADALIAPLVLKSTISGTGSGFRMTQSEINQVIGGRSKWEDLKAKLDKWSTDPSQALSITDDQRTQLRDIAKAIRAKANSKLTKITTARHALDDAKDVDGIHKVMTGLKDDLYLGDDEPKAASSADDLIKKYGGQ